MATTTNYGWTTPNDTDLVKDGASAIRTLGTAIDTTTKNLNPSTTLGDIEYRSSTANTNTRLGIGSTGQVLTVSSGVPAWGTVSGGGTTLISTTAMPTNASEVTISSIPTTYDQLIFRFFGTAQSGNPAVSNANYFALNGNTGNDFSYSISYVRDGTFYGYSSGSTGRGRCFNIDSNTGTAYEINVYKANESAPHYWDSKGVGRDVASSMASGLFNVSSPITSMTFYSTNGNFTAGNILTYGVKY
jgi:hypothetical protein